MGVRVAETLVEILKEQVNCIVFDILKVNEDSITILRKWLIRLPENTQYYFAILTGQFGHALIQGTARFKRIS